AREFPVWRRYSVPSAGFHAHAAAPGGKQQLQRAAPHTPTRVLALFPESLCPPDKEERRPRPKPRRWADYLKRDFGHDPLLDHTGKRMKWVRQLAPKPSC